MPLAKSHLVSQFKKKNPWTRKMFQLSRELVALTGDLVQFLAPTE